jgi:hypothetical protein
MPTLALTRALASIFVPIGITGAAIALVCALIAAFALARGSAGLAGGAIGIWIVGALLSAAASFANAWAPLVTSLAALGAALLVGGLMRAAVRGLRTMSERAPQQAASAEAAVAEAKAPVHPAAKPARPTTTVLPPASVTDSIRIAA